MEVILRSDLDDRGLEGDIIKVKRGYARNYLIPKGIALEATAQNIKSLEQQRNKIELRKVKAMEAAIKVQEQLEGMEITFAQRAGEEGKLYGSITSMDIASYLESKDIVIDRKKIMIEKPIKELGEFKATIRIYPKVNAGIKIIVLPDKEG
ncbi:50S ribosomal protein L9 [uncultured Desulfobacterium sp.]|uniref:Large ribosomal subunit protein bL9 n=1 Tax=uncultured Desulfobacterium sp. TaxID=201089 RepID=A0A445N2L4_9BACT|nr:50S ribosomal protein L9 [uncultured Desulfobacterium sp.]